LEQFRSLQILSCDKERRMDIVRAKPEKDHQELREIIQQYEAAHGFAGEGDPQNSFFLSCHRTRLLELENELSTCD